MSKRLLLSVDRATDLIESYPGEFFDPAVFDLRRLNAEEIQRHSLDTGYQQKIIVLSFCYYGFPDTDLSSFDLVMIVDEEATHEDSQVYLSNLRKKFNNHKILLIGGGYHKAYPRDHDHIYHYPFFLINIPRYNQHKTIVPPGNKPKLFDVLLGNQKYHRTVVFNSIRTQGLLDCCYVNFTTDQHTQKLKTIYRSSDIDDVDLAKNFPDNVFNSYVHDNHVGPRISQLIPWGIYDHSLYSVVTETNFRDYNFFTEKTAKCLYAGRVFFMFGAQGQLQDLRDLGFGTFGNVIDESYDDIQDDTQRYHAALAEMLRLVQQDPLEVYQATQKTLLHNQKHILDREYFLAPLKKWVYQRL
jgi:hypothetical protein